MREQTDVTLKNGPVELPQLDEAGNTVMVKSENDFGRDEGKIFRLTEMSALEREKWALKMMSITLRDPAEETRAQKTKSKHSATAALAEMPGEPSDQEKYLDLCNQMLYCYEVFDKAQGVYVQLTPQNIGQYIEENVSLGFLRQKAMDFNRRFFTTGGRSISR